MIFHLAHSDPTQPMSDASGDFVVPEMEVSSIITAEDLSRAGRGAMKGRGGGEPQPAWPRCTSGDSEEGEWRGVEEHAMPDSVYHGR